MASWVTHSALNQVHTGQVVDSKFVLHFVPFFLSDRNIK